MKATQAQKQTQSSEIQTAPMMPAVLLTPQQLAAKLAIPVSWIREKTRERARLRDEDPLPVVRLGKYVRFDWTQVLSWLQRQIR
jgi:hypothetical protein